MHRQAAAGTSRRGVHVGLLMPSDCTALETPCQR